MGNCHRDFEFHAYPENDCCYDPKQNGVCDGKLGTTTCCTPDKKCGLGGGDCDSDKDCKAGLKCGNNNCHRDFLTSAHLKNDCCYDPKQKVYNSTPVCDGSPGQDSCCNPSNKCGLGGGDCDTDHDCEAGLKCGNNNCREFNPNAEADCDCCYSPKKQVPLKALEIDGKKYYCNIQSTSWNAAKRNCVADGGQLALLKNGKLRRQIRDHCDSNSEKDGFKYGRLLHTFKH